MCRLQPKKSCWILTGQSGKLASKLKISYWSPRLLALIAVAVCLLPAATAGGAEAPYRCVPLDVPRGGQAGFTLLDPAQTGLNFTNTLSEENASENQIRLNRSEERRVGKECRSRWS